MQKKRPKQDTFLPFRQRKNSLVNWPDRGARAGGSEWGRRNEEVKASFTRFVFTDFLVPGPCLRGRNVSP